MDARGPDDPTLASFLSQMTRVLRDGRKPKNQFCCGMLWALQNIVERTMELHSPDAVSYLLGDHSTQGDKAE
ncbi:MAG: hypothetical protein WC763_06920 [Candidatus Paceibacterota bacterium]